MSQTNWEADKMLDVYIYDYLVKRNLRETAKAFQAEAKVSPDPVAIDAPGGFLFEWWSVFWDIFIARTNEKHSDTAASYIETQQIKAREQQQQQQQQQPQQPQQQQQQQQQQMQMQQIFLQRQAQQLQQQQQLREGAHILNGTANRLAATDPLMRQNPGTANAMATKMYEEQLKLPLQRDSSEEASMKQRIGENGGQLLDPNHASLLKSAATSGQASGQILHGSAGGLPGTLQHVQARNQQLAGSSQDIKADMNSAVNSRGTDASFNGMPGSNQVGNSLTLKGWPLTGLDQLRSGLLQQQKPFTQSSQPFNQLQFLSPQQQQLVIQAQQNLTSSTGDIDSIKLRMLLNNRNLGLGKDGHSSSTGEAISNAGSPMQSGGGPVVPRPETDILNKKMAQFQQQQQLQCSNQQQQHHAIISQQSQSSNQYVHQQEKMSVDNVTPFKNQSGNKRKQPVSSSGPANSSGTANTAGPSPNSAPSTPSTHTPGDVIPVSSLQHNCSSSKPLSVFGSDGAGPISSAQLAGIDRFVDDGSLEENVESFFSPDDTDLRDTAGRCGDGNKGFTFSEAGSTRASTNKVVCCHFSSDGKLLATGAHDKKAVLWYADTLKPQSTLQEHSFPITDVRFSPSLPRLATSSFDKTVRVWDADNPGYSLRTFTGHSTSVMSLDFHPSKEELICSCDVDGEMRYWNIINGSCARVFKGGSAQMRFQPRLGRYLAAAAQNGISIIDTETQACRYSLQGHMKNVISVCWDPSGELVASVSEDSVRVWSVASGGEGECVHELNCNGSKFHSCVFHPTYPTLLVIGCYQSIELWDMAQDKTMTLQAHECLVASLAASSVTGMVASVSHDTFVKLWK